MSAMPEGCALAFDFGERRIGVAVGDTILGIPHPLATIDTAVTDERFAAIAKLIEEWQPRQLVVGLPMHPDGEEHALSALSRRFANRLKGRFGLPVWLVDERYTSVIAEQLLEEAGVKKGRKQKPALDQVAAQAILAGWFEQPGTAV
ncbi:Holliday junction resolvase RuvX [Chromobacterium piscinae]|uniref:Putative pre-16S rRNA nuclease n=1 Tax=Chromobacterium piscinae TaxID=686831 RepID=A0ABV0H4Z5_9NEIS|nr:Holliday junction resolvase RuvX [Chromobacterium piscinae]MBX9295327.1 Holliday junction resolvase RuvX [Chromobacterium vaccinii]MBX9349891.1 Holliday junction resolvase RuvX [Chromobacterium vaccinii]MBX9357334.1 Holliday junction resolvase RuvX [Chromobacterium vaccinii]MCD5330194.1 Holliday junction resolvase RuvX [Chromobacterium piscinae]